ncbi:MAG: hypothetical protein MSA90_04660 [Faecalicatena sp.]|uniref:hypothetical protein n=1 Tax=Faecalicatena sp. TaxID=2005360 RepID=UPI00258C025F|nr:hypothetical protein [Faecalicatena sp.]MCI6464742.1 hypothetical protein [Faecalicatena sp.]MDY5618319.1 hypothetical protein [Lachnospiraceae bacterium]
MYKAKNVDTEKALNYINYCREYQNNTEALKRVETEKYYEGIRKGLDIAEEIFTSANCEAPIFGTYEEGASDAICYIAKELDVGSQDICDSGKSLDKMCVDFANRIRDSFDGSHDD